MFILIQEYQIYVKQRQGTIEIAGGNKLLT